MTTKRILLAATTLAPGDGGIGRVARLMTKVLAEESAAGRFDAEIISLSGDVSDVPNKISISDTHGSRSRFILKVHSAGLNHSHFLFDSLGMERAHCRIPFLRKPSLSWFHGIDVWEDAPLSRLRSSRRSDFLVVNTNYTRERAQRIHGGFERAKVCWLATDTDELPSNKKKIDGPPTVMIMARLSQEEDKGHKNLIDCWPTVVSKVPDARLLVVGRGPDFDDFRRLAAQSSVASQIEFLGFVPDSEIQKIWSEATVFAMPSRGEGFGLVYVEAMRQGLPVIASVHDAAPEINIHGKTGYNVNLDVEEELPERLIDLLKNPDRAAQLGNAGRERWQKHFRYSDFKARFLPILSEFLEL